MYINFVRIERFASHSINIKCSPAVEYRFHLFKTFPFRLFDKEEDNYRHDNIEDCVEEENVTAPGIHHVARHQREKEVEKPLCRYCDRGSDRPNTRWEDLPC
jgi:hypothetical protein